MLRKFLLCTALISLAACDKNFLPDPNPREESVKVLEKAKGPDIQGVSETLISSAREYEGKGDFGRAALFYKQILDKDATNIEAMMGYGECLRRQGEFERAISMFDQVILRAPRSAEAIEGKALSLMGKGETAQASQYFQQVMQLDPSRWRTINAVGILFAMKGLYKEAMAYYEAALKLSPNTPSVLNNVALTQALAHNYDAAIQTLTMARGYAKSESDEQKKLDLNLALAYGLSGRMDEAERVASQHLSKEALYNNMGFYAYLAKNDDLAKSYLNMALSQSKTFYERAWTNLDEVAGDTKRTTPTSSLPQNQRESQEGDSHLAPAAGGAQLTAPASPIQQVSAPADPTIPLTPDAAPAAPEKKKYSKKKSSKKVTQKSLPPVEVTE